ncbi:hypothetical protein OOU_Y34scaffold00666g207 [Pyricularia oryzae Y34]|uniref:Uncharacterized protein n=4 Tax=Pyricularia oryzae TaxID=318829 RepID=Q2KGK5_PYRO7|nr:hypothetical protein MGCH7_ch7g330 [Pyricularia oryzae 70-15]ELQ36346.1 hypothetical protein OOU_Y34scaffold00666g207 [Pyricularia oryzae Y34]QBZ66191.1 hypothetical protein PoMZ_13163 [Pyricularia oryzae]
MDKSDRQPRRGLRAWKPGGALREGSVEAAKAAI